VGDLPSNAVASTTTWLDIKVGVDRIAQLYVPVLLSFSIFALLAAAFTITNLVSGVVLTSYRDIGVMKSIGFTPNQVSGILLAQILVPVTIGAIGGVVLGSLASQPILANTAESFGLPAVSTISIPVILLVVLGAVAIATLAAIVPSIRAGRISAVAAIAHGRAPASPAGATRRRLVGLGLPFGLPVRLGVASGLSHVPRAAMTLGALVVGVSAVTMAIGLNASLLQIKEDLDRSIASPVRAEIRDSTDPAGVTTAIAADSRTGRSTAIGDLQVTVPHVGVLPLVGYDGDSTWLGYRLIEGRWFSAPGEAVAPTNVFTQTGLHVGDVTTLTEGGRTVTVRLVGEILDSARENRDNLVLRGTFADLRTLDPSVRPDRWEMQPKPGVDPETYAGQLQTSLAGVQVSLENASGEDTSFTLFLGVIGLMGIVLTAMSLGGVFNTVLLETRQRTREMAVLKTLGMSPNGVVTMVVASVIPLALLAGLIGVPLGLLAQRAVLTYMGEIAVKTRIPPASFDVFSPAALLALALTGLAIGAAGAFVPARRAARARIAPVLQAE
ncbi:MAG TPA: FtsX-like permease family protein, partial [Candidatus Limnocylindrales bacterium]